MEIVFLILQLISVIAWVIYAIKTFVELKKDEDYFDDFIKMQIALIFIWIFHFCVKFIK